MSDSRLTHKEKRFNFKVCGLLKIHNSKIFSGNKNELNSFHDQKTMFLCRQVLNKRREPCQVAPGAKVVEQVLILTVQLNYPAGARLLGSV